MPFTSLGFPQPIIGSNNWGIPTNAGWALLDRFLSGQLAVPSFKITNDLTVGGNVTAGGFSFAGGASFLSSADFDVPFGIPQLNAAGLIPASLLSYQALVPVAFSTTPVFNAAVGGAFKLTLTGNVASSTFANGLQGPSIVVFRFLQDGTGGRTFAWPGNVRNGGVVNPGPNARSVQIFALDTDGSLDAIGPIQYS
jgi:hypothetical protein